MAKTTIGNMDKAIWQREGRIFSLPIFKIFRASQTEYNNRIRAITVTASAAPLVPQNLMQK